MNEILFFDLEVDQNHKIKDIGAWFQGAAFHEISLYSFSRFAGNALFAAGHNIFNHDLPLLRQHCIDENFFHKQFIDTLYLSALLFPAKPYHKLVKDYKLLVEELNNPVSDARIAERLFADCLQTFLSLPVPLKSLYYSLLNNTEQFHGFFSYLNTCGLLANNQTDIQVDNQTGRLMSSYFKDKICINCDLDTLIKNYPLQLAFALALVDTNPDSVHPPWLVHHHPEILPVLHRLRYNRCGSNGCSYCFNKLDPKRALENIFGFKEFRSFEDNEKTPLQEQAVLSALDNRSFLAVFPTGGGKSLTFQLPALIRGEASRCLTVVISPLQSLMKDQVDILKDRHERTDAAALNSLLSPLERSEAIDRIENGGVSILYLSPESLRSRTIARILAGRVIDRFVIDEAHCFSSWGQDFRTDYLYIGDFIKQLIKVKKLSHPIPVSCFTATAKPSVIEDILQYFKDKLGLDLEVFRTSPKRKNLTFGVYRAADDEEKFSILLDLLSRDDSPKIVYTTRVKRSEELAQKLRDYGYQAAAYNGQMPREQKIEIQEAFMNGKLNIITATSAFGMGIDKEDVAMVIHYNIADSLENYMQEAGRAGRNREIAANCYVLYDDNDLMGHFNLLNATRINKKEIYQVWRAIKNIRQEKFSRSALELARSAGWDAELHGWEMRLKTALTALEESGLIKRGQDLTRIMASGLQVKNMAEAAGIIQQYGHFDESDRLHALRIIKYIISHKESAVDYIALKLDLSKYDTRRLINELKGLGLINSGRDLSAFIDVVPGSKKNSLKVFEKYSRLEIEFFDAIKEKTNLKIALKELNSAFRERGIDSDIESLRTILFLWKSRGLVNKQRLDRQNHIYLLQCKDTAGEIKRRILNRLELAQRILDKLVMTAEELQSPARSILVDFSVKELRDHVEQNALFRSRYALIDFDKTLLYLNEIGALRLDKGLFVYYNPFSITRCNLDDDRSYTKEDYNKFAAFYEHKIEQIHIVGEYARKLVDNYKKAMAFVEDYFNFDYRSFIKKYFPGRTTQIRRPITEEQFQKIYSELSPEQLQIINDNKSRAVLVAAGPGSGKTRVLVHKVASLLTIEDVRTEQFLMLTYSRSAAIEMKERLRALIGKKSRYIDIFTFHSFAFHIVEIKGSIEHAQDIIPQAIELIEAGETTGKAGNKSVLVIDEFQDIGSQEFLLIEAIISAAGDIRVLVVGDDDQNIFEFRGSSARYMKEFKEKFQAAVYHLNTNYRSKNNLVQFSNHFIKQLPGRVKAGQELVSSRPGEDGSITIVKYRSNQLVVPVVRSLARQCRRAPGLKEKLIAVLTATNDEALQVYTLLRQEGIKAKLLISYADFSLKSLIELKVFSFFLEEYATGSCEVTIPRKQWQLLKEKTCEKFPRSRQLPLARQVIETFEKEHEHLLAVNWREYLDEIRLEDLIYPDQGTVFISTMHKAKGKEFDIVHLLLNESNELTEERKRVIYVALTRAKEQLVVHTRMDIFDGIEVSRCSRIFDENPYDLPNWFSIQLTPRDVYLDFFTHEHINRTIKEIQAGDDLQVSEHDPWLFDHYGKSVLKLSNNGVESIEKLLKRGYVIASISAEYITVWKKKEDEEQYRIVLPRIELIRKGQTD